MGKPMASSITERGRLAHQYVPAPLEVSSIDVPPPGPLSVSFLISRIWIIGVKKKTQVVRARKLRATASPRTGSGHFKQPKQVLC